MAKPKGKKASIEALDTATRRSRVLQLARDTGCSDWRTIARTLEEEFGAALLPKGWDARYAHKDFMRELEHVRNLNLQNALEIRAIEDARLDDLYRVLRDGIRRETNKTDPDARTIATLSGRIIQLMHRRARMHGLDMPILIRFIDRVDFGKLPDDLLERIASGEDPAVVLSNYATPGEA